MVRVGNQTGNAADYGHWIDLHVSMVDGYVRRFESNQAVVLLVHVHEFYRSFFDKFLECQRAVNNTLNHFLG